MGGKTWGPKEDGRLREMAGCLPVAEIARQLGRTQRAVRWRSEVLQVSLSVIRCYSLRQATSTLGISKYTLLAAREELKQQWSRTRFRPDSGKSKYTITPAQLGEISRHLKEKNSGQAGNRH